MKIITTVAEMKAQVAEWKAEGLTIGLTPTMGALHEGHMSLMERAAKECDRVVTSVFVNPIQFGPNEDYDNYPRDLEHDAAIAESKGVDVVFHPEPEEMYPKNYNTLCSYGNSDRHALRRKTPRPLPRRMHGC